MSILITIIGFGIMVFLHELGHFLTAKSFGVLVHEFAIGMGPKIFSFGKGETKYSLRLLPLGGYVKLEGENDVEENTNPRSFSNLPPFKRIIVLVSGALMNILLGILIFTVINLKVGIQPTVIGGIPEEFPTNNEIFSVGDEITELDGTNVHTMDDVSLFMSRNNSKTIDITIERDGKEFTVEDFKLHATRNGYKLGVMFNTKKAGVFESAQFALYDTVNVTKAVYFAVGDLITGKEDINNLSGPVEIVGAVGQVTEQTQGETRLIMILLLFAMISVNLGIFNLLPFPALDGGSIIFALYELITRKKVKSEIVGYASVIGFILLMVLALYVTVGDILAL